MLPKNTFDSLGLTSYQMSVSINAAQRAFNVLLKTCLSHHNLTIPQWVVLGMIDKNNVVRPMVIAKQLGMKPPYIAKLLNGLVIDGFIVSSQYADDERGKTIRLSATGRELIDQVEPQLADCLREVHASTFFAVSEFIAQNVRHHQ
jgi:MarR family transcriptional regulator for hemolysin